MVIKSYVFSMFSCDNSKSCLDEDKARSSQCPFIYPWGDNLEPSSQAHTPFAEPDYLVSCIKVWFGQVIMINTNASLINFELFTFTKYLQCQADSFWHANYKTLEVFSVLIMIGANVFLGRGRGSCQCSKVWEGFNCAATFLSVSWKISCMTNLCTMSN